MDFSSINWLAVVVCVLVNFAIGSVWYSPRAFFTTWWKGIGKTGTPGQGGQAGANMAPVWILTVVAAFLQVIFLALLIGVTGKAMGGPSLFTGLETGFLVWLGLIAPSNLVNKLFAGWPFRVFFIEAGNHLVNYLVWGAILGAWH